MLHSYISNTGDLWPCDFIPVSFGNVVEEDLKEVYGRMMALDGVPRSSCMARAVADRLDGREFPLLAEENEDLCQACPTRSYPQFFKDLQAP